MVHLKVAPEVSTLDFSNSVTLQGFSVPALATRRTETQVELRDGQTFAIAGLLDRNVNETLERVPGIGDIPILGYLFRSQKYKKNHTELVVMITPHIVRSGEPGVTPNLPALEQPFLPVPNKRVPQPPPAFSNPTSGGDQVAPARSVVSTAPASKTPVAAAIEPVASIEPAASEMRVNDNERKAADKAIKDLARQQAVLSQQQQKQSAASQRTAAVQARQEQERTREAGKIEAARAAKDQQAAARQQAIDAERQKREQKISEKRAAEQAIVDRKRWMEQQAQAAEAKEAADKLAREQEKIKKEQDRLAKEQAARQSELARLVSQYRKLTEGQTTQPTQ